MVSLLRFLGRRGPERVGDAVAESDRLNLVASISVGVICALSVCAGSAQASCDDLRQQVQAMQAAARDQRSGAAQMRKEGSSTRGNSADYIQAAKDYEEAAQHFETAAALYQQQLAACASASTSSKRPIETPNRAPSTSAPTIIEVRWGDTFSGIAATITGDARKWRELYDPQNSGVTSPDLIFAGSHFELVRQANGTQYLRLVEAEGASPVAAAGAAAKRAPAAPAAAAAGLAQASRDEPDALVVGVLPNISAEKLMAQYEHMKHYLEALNTQKISISTSPNFKAFFESTMNGDFDLAVSAPHFARVAQLDRGLIPLVIYEPRISALLITPADQTLASPLELRGKVVAFANPQSLVAMYGRQWLGQQGLQAGKDFEVRGPRTDLGVGRMLLTGEATAAIMSNGEFRALPPEESARLKIAQTIAQIPNFVVLANPRLNRALMARLKTQLKGFLANQDDGAAFANATGITAMNDANEAQLRELDGYVEQTRSAMGIAKRGSPLAAAAPAAKPAPAPAAAGLAQAPNDEPDALVVGVLPNISAEKLMAQYEHMKHYLEALNTQKISISTSPNFKAFFESTMNGDYDLAVSAPHFARVAQLDRGLIPLVIYEPRISALLITLADRPLGSATELRGKVVAFANPQSLVAMYGLAWLGQQGLQPGKDFEVRGPRTDLGVGRMLLTGEASAAIMSNGEFRALPPEESARLKIGDTIARIPNFVVLANPRLNRGLVARLKTQLKGFLANQDDGAAFASATGISAMSDVDEAQLRELDSYVEQTRRAMGITK
jgi:phosphonate transport system substrate-binding protein